MAGHYKRSLKSETGCFKLIVLLNSAVFPGHFDIRTTVQTQVVTKLLSVKDPLIAEGHFEKFWDVVVN